MNRSRVDFKGVNCLAASSVLRLLDTLLLTGRMERGEWVAFNPHRDDRSLGSFRLNTITGRWADFATGDRGGDFISYVAFVKRISQLEAAKTINSILGGNHA